MKLFSSAIKTTADGKLQDGRGLFLRKKGGSSKWVFRYSYLGKRREMGLGTWPEISLAEARRIRDRWSAVLAHGRDPIAAREEEREQQRLEQERMDPTFADLVELVFDAKKATLRGEGTKGRWRSPLDQYMIPAIGRKPGSKLTQRDIADALRPIWRTKYPTAEKAIQRTRIVLTSAKLMGFP
jgi:hypothetical protein